MDVKYLIGKCFSPWGLMRSQLGLNFTPFPQVPSYHILVPSTLKVLCIASFLCFWGKYRWKPSHFQAQHCFGFVAFLHETFSCYCGLDVWNVYLKNADFMNTEHTEEGGGRGIQGTCRSKRRSEGLKVFHAEELCLLSSILLLTQV